MQDVLAGHVERGAVSGLVWLVWLVWLVARRGDVHVGWPTAGCLGRPDGPLEDPVWAGRSFRRRQCARSSSRALGRAGP
jgi:hypothetical protein